MKDPRAFWARAMLQLIVAGEEDESVADLRQAVELDPLNATYRANLAQLLCGLSLESSTLSIGMQEEGEEELTGSEDALVEAETHFGLACELDPQNEPLRESHTRFLELLQAKSGTK